MENKSMITPNKNCIVEVFKGLEKDGTIKIMTGKRFFVRNFGNYLMEIGFWRGELDYYLLEISRLYFTARLRIPGEIVRTIVFRRYIVDGDDYRPYNSDSYIMALEINEAINIARTEDYEIISAKISEHPGPLLSYKKLIYSGKYIKYIKSEEEEDALKEYHPTSLPVAEIPYINSDNLVRRYIINNKVLKHNHERTREKILSCKNSLPEIINWVSSKIKITECADMVFLHEIIDECEIEDVIKTGGKRSNHIINKLRSSFSFENVKYSSINIQGTVFAHIYFLCPGKEYKSNPFLVLDKILLKELDHIAELIKLKFDLPPIFSDDPKNFIAGDRYNFKVAIHNFLKSISDISELLDCEDVFREAYEEADKIIRDNNEKQIKINDMDE